jgi:hypothetical protein
MTDDIIKLDDDMTRSQLYELSLRVKYMSNAMHKLLEFVEREGIGMEHGFCDKYPFPMSFDEFLHEVFAWQEAIDEKYKEKKRHLYT